MANLITGRPRVAAAGRAAHAVPGVSGHIEPPDDVALAQKVESIAFRKAGVPKGHVSVNAVNGLKNLLHTPPR